MGDLKFVTYSIVLGGSLGSNLTGVDDFCWDEEETECVHLSPASDIPCPSKNVSYSKNM